MTKYFVFNLCEEGEEEKDVSRVRPEADPGVGAGVPTHKKSFDYVLAYMSEWCSLRAWGARGGATPSPRDMITHDYGGSYLPLTTNFFVLD